MLLTWLRNSRRTIGLAYNDRQLHVRTSLPAGKTISLEGGPWHGLPECTIGSKTVKPVGKAGEFSLTVP